MTITPGRPFWSGVTALCANMVALFGVDQIDLTNQPIAVSNWWVAGALSLFVGLAVYAKAKADELNDPA